jgi:23S rRNA (cytosine1962-C5)-methyltransferase
MRVPILYRDADLVVVDKPAGIPTHATDPADPYPGDALRIVQAQEELSYLGMHQRLDADTSGVLLFTARRSANPAVAAAFAERNIKKVYLALVHGTPRQNNGVIDAPIARQRDGHYGVTSPSDRLGQPARTRYRLLATAPQRDYSLLEVVPETGRSHQIRVHLAHAGIPIVGDPLYGPRDRRAPRLCLHAYQLSLLHPEDARPITDPAPVPRLFERLAEGLPELRLAASLRHVRAAVREPEALHDLLRLAVERRAPLAADPGTTIYRLVHGAGDGLPGLTADRYGDVLVASFYDEDVPPLPAPPEILEALATASGTRTVYVKYRPKQASRVTGDETEMLAPRTPLHGPQVEDLVALEEGLVYQIRPGDGFSTGIFADMRETRARVRAWAAGRRVLNCFAYTCAFGVAATAGNAQRVLNLDLAKPALERGQANYRTNGFEPDPHDFVYGDVFDWLGRLARRGERYDMVILDPPGFSTTKSGRFVASRDYAKLAGLAAAVTAADGLILACANVVGLSWRDYRDQVLEGLAAAGRQTTVAGIYHAPAIDFPVPPDQESHLKVLAVRLS